jgi:hypothetical protein
MIELDAADLVVIAGQVLGIGTDAALGAFNIAAAEAALAEARLTGQEAASAAARPHRSGSRPAGTRPHRAVAGAAAVALMHALLRRPPVPGHGEQLAVAAGLQLLAVNGWQADLDVPRAAAITIASLASGQLTPADAASWLSVRLSPDPASPASEVSARGQRLAGSRAGRVMLAPVAAVRHHQHRHSGPGPFVIMLGSADRPSGIRTPATGLMPFTAAARNVVVRSGQEARRLGQPRGTEHFLLNLIGESDGVAARALDRLGISQEAVRRHVEQILAEQMRAEDRPQNPPGRLDGPEAKRLWPAVLDEAVAHGDGYIGTEHFLLALFSNSDATAAQALASLGAGEDQVRGLIAALLAESGPERPA